MRITGPLRHIAVTTALIVFFTSASSRADIAVIDDSGHRIVLSAPAKRIVSLAPHVTELLFAAGASKKVVGVSSASDFPAEALRLPSMGNSSRIDMERIALLKPDLIVAWTSGNHPRQIAQLRKQGYVVFESEPKNFEAIASTLEKLGKLTDSTQGADAAARFRDSIASLRHQYQGRDTVNVFYQIWPTPLMTLNGQHLASQALSLCGATNIFGRLPQLAPTVSRESVLEANPDAILVSDESGSGLSDWRKISSLKAVRQQQVFKVDGNLLNRAGPRMPEAIASLCKQIDSVRNHQRHQLP
jgi:iron complex transport system substrate-binding protein